TPDCGVRPEEIDMRRKCCFILSVVVAGVLLASGCGSVEPLAVRASGVTTPGNTAPAESPTPTTPTSVAGNGNERPPTGSTTGSTTSLGTAHVTGSATDEDFDGVPGVIITFQPDTACRGCVKGAAVTQQDGAYALDLIP